MRSFPTSTWINVSFLLLFLLILVWRRCREPRRPPGPRRFPFLGNLLQMPQSKLWEKALDWQREYGDLVYLENLGKPLLIVNSYETAVELLGKISAIYSSRPPSVMADLEGWNWLPSTAPYGNYLRRARAHQHRFFNSPETLNFLDSQTSEARRTVKNILNHPNDYEELISRCIDHEECLWASYSEDRYVNLGVSAVKYIADTDQYFLIESFPFLRNILEWFPWTNLRQMTKDARKVFDVLRTEQHDMLKKQVAEGTAKDCMMTTLIEENTREDGVILEEEEIRGAAVTVFLGGVHTTTTAIMTFVLGMLKNPEAHRLGQLEIDRVVGPDRLPSFDDKDHLPYIQAICEEALRYGSVAPLGFPHYTTEDDVYRGFDIPAGTSVLPNQWAMSYDPEIHKEPLSFEPECWLPTRDGRKSDNPLPHNYQFGFGRRACVGQKWAENLLFITVATILSTCDIEKAIGKDGEPIEPNDVYDTGFVRSLGPSQCKITSRSLKAESLLEASALFDFDAKGEFVTEA